MRVYFWGTRGSLPTACDAAEIRGKIKSAIEAARGRDLGSAEAIESLIDSLPFSVRGTYGGNTSCVEIRGGDEYVICDAGSGLRDLGAYLMRPEVLKRPKPPRVFNILMSHLHWDHIMGFPFFIPAFIPGNTIRIHSPHEDPRGTFVKQQEAPNFPVPLKAMGADISFHRLEPGETRKIGGFDVRTLKQNHPGGSYGYRFERAGRAVVYSTDAEHKSESTEKDYPFLAPGQPVALTTDAFPNETFHGEITRIAPVFRQAARQARVELRVENPDLRLKPGLFIRAAVVLQHLEEAVVVPEAALTRRAEQEGVFLLDADGTRVQWRAVNVGIRDGERVQLLGEPISGPITAQRVVTLGQQLLDDGSEVILPDSTAKKEKMDKKGKPSK